MDYEIAKKLLSYAIRAPSTHNSQPWLFKIKNDSIQVYADPSRYTITEGDPLKRYFYISLGACVENLIIVAQHFGYYDRVEFFDNQRNDNLIAEIFVKEGVPNESHKNLCNAILTRINVRGVFDPKPIQDDAFAALQGITAPPGIHMEIVHSDERIQELAKLTAEGLRIAYRKPAFRKEMSHWIHSNLSRKKDGLIGYSLRMSLIPSLILPTLIQFIDIGSKLGSLNYASVASAKAIMLLSSEKQNYSSWRAMGQYFEHLALTLETQGIHTSIFVAGVEAGLIPNAEFLLCAGYMEKTQLPSPRRPLQAMIIR